MGKNETAIIDKNNNILDVNSGSKNVLKVTGLFDLIALRDLLNDAYPIGTYGKQVSR